MPLIIKKLENRIVTQLEHIEAIEKRLWGAADTMRANSNYLEQQLGLESVYAHNNENFDPDCMMNGEVAV